MHDARQGIVHVIGLEQGATLPGMTVVCGDSHTSTHGAFARWLSASAPPKSSMCSRPSAWCRRNRARPGVIEGKVGEESLRRDMVLALIGCIGTAGGKWLRHRVRRPGDRALSRGRSHDDMQHGDRGRRARRHGGGWRRPSTISVAPFAPKGPIWDKAVGFGGRGQRRGCGVCTGDRHGCRRDPTAGDLGHVAGNGDVPIDGWCPIRDASDPVKSVKARALQYMGLDPACGSTRLRSTRSLSARAPIRASKLRAAAAVVRGGAWPPRSSWRWWCRVSAWSKTQAEAEGLDKIQAAGFEWRRPVVPCVWP